MAFTDDFNRADEQIDASANWTCGIANTSPTYIGVRSNAVAQLNAGNEQTAICPDQGSADHYTQVVSASNSSWGGFVCCRVNVANATQYYGVRYTGSAWELYKYNSGFTLLGSWTGSNSGATMYLEASGDQITVKINGTTRIGPVTDSTLTGTRQGLRARSTLNPWIDNFEAGVLAAAAASLVYYQPAIAPLLVR